MSIKLGILGGGLGVVVLGGAIVYNAGAVRVSVLEKKPDGEHIHLVLPAAVVPVALKFVPEEKLRYASEKLRPWLPAIKVASEELARCQDGPLVLVEGSDEKVSITKQGGSLVIDVDSPDENVHVSFPLKTLASAAEELVAKAPPQ